MGGGNEKVVDEVLVAGLHSDPALATASLVSIDGDRTPLDIAGMGYGDDHILFRNHVFDADLFRLLDDLGAALVAVLLFDLGELVADDVANLLLAGENGFQLRNPFLNLLVLGNDLLPLHAGQSLQLEVEDGLRLPLGKLVALNQAAAGCRGGLGASDQLNDVVEIVEGGDEAFQNVRPLPRLAQLERRPPANHVASKVEDVSDDLQKWKHSRPVVDDREHVDAEARLERRVLVEVVEHDLTDFATLEIDDDAHSATVGLVAHLRDAFDAPVAHQLADFLEKPGLVDLIGDLSHHDRLAVLRHVFDDRPCSQLNRSPPGAVGLLDALAAVQERRGGKIGPGDAREEPLGELVLRRLGIVEHEDHSVYNLAQIVRRNIGSHTHRDPRSAVHEQVGHRGGKHRRLPGAAVEVGD